MRSEQAAPVAPATPPASRPEPAFRRALRHPRAPEALLAIGTFIVAAYAISVAVRVSGWALDETIVKQSALHYRHGLPSTLFHDLNARATSRLYPLLLMPIFAIWDGDTALRMAHAASVPLFCSASIPVYLLARRVLRSPWFAAAAGVLAIATPWLTISTALYTENLAYPLFLWTLLAMVWAVERSSWKADLLVVVMVGLCTTARVQLFALLPAWLIATWAISWARRERGASGARETARGFARRAWRIAPISHALLGLGVLLAFVRWRGGHLHGDARRLLGTYSELQDRPHVSTDVFLAVAHELQALALPAFLAAAAALAWFAGALRAPRNDRRFVLAAVSLAVVAVVWLVTAYVQGGFIGDLTEERYYFYAFPLVWIGAFAALEDPKIPAGRIAAAGIGLLLLFATLGQARALDPQSAFLAPSSASVRNIFERVIGSLQLTGLSTRDGLALVGIALLALGAWAWPRLPRGRLIVFVAIPVVLQLAVGAYAFAARDGRVPGVQAQTGGDIPLNAWIDHHSGGNDVTWLNNQAYQVDPSAEGWQYPTLLWNSRIQQWAQDPRSGLGVPVATLAALPVRTIAAVDARTGLVKGLERAGPFVSYIDSPFFQIAGQSIAKGPGNRLELVQPVEPVHAIWRAGPFEVDGSVNPQIPVALDAWAPPGAKGKGLRIEIDLAGPPTGATQVEFQLGGRKRTVALQPNEAKTEVFHFCPKGVHVAGKVRGLNSVVLPDGRNASGRFAGVRVLTEQGGGC